MMLVFFVFLCLVLAERRSGARSNTSSTPTSSSMTRPDARARPDGRPEARARPHGRSRSNTNAGYTNAASGEMRDRKVLSSSPTRPGGRRGQSAEGGGAGSPHSRRGAQPMSWGSFMMSANEGEGTSGESTTTTTTTTTGRRRDEKEHSPLPRRSGREQERALPPGEREKCIAPTQLDKTILDNKHTTPHHSIPVTIQDALYNTTTLHKGGCLS